MTEQTARWWWTDVPDPLRPPETDEEPATYSVNPVNDRKVWLAAGAVYLVLVAVLLTLTWRREA